MVVNYARQFEVGYLVLLGVGTVALLARTLDGVVVPDSRWWQPTAVLALLFVLARRYPVGVAARDRGIEISAAAAFAFALLVLLPFPTALAVIALGAVVPVRRPERRRAADVAARICRDVLSFAAGGWVLGWTWALLAGWFDLVQAAAASTLPWQLLLALLPAGLVSWAAATVLDVLRIVVTQRLGPRQVVRQDVAAVGLAATLVVVGLAPVVLLVAERAVLLAPSLLLLVIGLHRSSLLVATEQHDARHDPLTGLANRRRLEERLTSLVDTQLDDRFALLLMDLDRFKEVNDQLGHHVGDKLLAEVGGRLTGLRDVDLAARIGGDEFAFLVRGVDDHARLVRVGERLIARVSEPYIVEDVRLTIGASVGIAVFPDHALDGPSLLRRADSAMYEAKRSRAGVGISSLQAPQRSPGRISLLAELEGGIERGQLKLDYQPKVRASTGEVVGVESLLRWHHPEHGLIPPSLFVSTVEHTDLIRILTRHVIVTVLADVQKWRVAGIEVPVAINVSARDLRDETLAPFLAEQLAAHDVAPEMLTLEITEHALQFDPERAEIVLDELRQLGVRLAIDDFGTGYSSLAALRRLPVDELKIDRAFVVDIDDEADATIVRTIAELAHGLALQVVAEGVEDEATAARLLAYGCDVLQGYHVSRPLPAHLVAPWVRARREELAEGRHPLESVLAAEVAPSAGGRGRGPLHRRMRVVGGAEPESLEA